MLVDLVQIHAEDGLRLDGAFQEPMSGRANAARFDAVVCLHGTGSNFYSSSLFSRLTPRWLHQGIGVVWANTRGHDGLSMAVTTQGRRRQGAAFEKFSESPADLRAWAEWLVARGYSRIGFVGHSSGAVKAIYTQATRPHPAIVGVVAISPPRLSFSHFCASAKKTEFLDTFRRAELLCGAGESSTLLDVTFPLSYTISAGGYLEKYGRVEDYNILKLLPNVACPTLVTYGQVEVEHEVAFQQLPDAITALALAPGRIQVATVPGADHVYTGQIAALGDVLEPWLTTDGGGAERV